MTVIRYGMDCRCDGCDGFASKSVWHLDSPRDDEPITVDFELTLAESTFRCDRCGCVYYTGDIDTLKDDDCRLEDEDDEDEDEE